MSEYFQSNLHGEFFKSYLAFHGIGCNTATQFHQKYERQQDGESHDHTVVLLDSSTTSKESDEKDDTSHDHQQDRSIKDAIAQEIEVLGIYTLNHPTRHDKNQPRQLYGTNQSHGASGTS